MKKFPVSVVLLAHNEADVIEEVVLDFLEKIVKKNPDSEIIIAEDGSVDGTKEILYRLATKHPLIKLVQSENRMGYVEAYKKAMTYPKNELILFCDASGKHEPNDYWDMIKLINNFDLIIGYKLKRADPLYRIFIGRVFNFLVNQYFGVNFFDIDCPFRIFKKSAFNNIANEKWFEKALINFEMTLRFIYRGYKVTQVPIKHYPRKNGASRGLPLNKLFFVIINVLKVFPKLKKEIISKSYRARK